jgi:hypothetical protein
MVKVVKMGKREGKEGEEKRKRGGRDTVKMVKVVKIVKVVKMGWEKWGENVNALKHEYTITTLIIQNSVIDIKIPVTYVIISIKKALDE